MRRDGAASLFLKLSKESLLEYVEALFRRKGDSIVEINKKAFELGRKAAQ